MNDSLTDSWHFQDCPWLTCNWNCWGSLFRLHTYPHSLSAWSNTLRYSTVPYQPPSTSFRLTVQSWKSPPNVSLPSPLAAWHFGLWRSDSGELVRQRKSGHTGEYKGWKSMATPKLRSGWTGRLLPALYSERPASDTVDASKHPSTIRVFIHVAFHFPRYWEVIAHP